MLISVKDSFHWALALRKFALSDFNGAKLELYQVRGNRKKYSEYFALLGTIHILLMSHREANDAFLTALNNSNTRKVEYREYVRLYSKYYISVITGNEEKKEEYLELALNTSAPTIIRQWLPLSRITKTSNVFDK